MSGWIAGAMIVSAVVGASEGEKTRKAAATEAEAQRQTAREAKALSEERFGEAGETLEPYVEEARTAREQLMIEMGLAPGEAGTAYMETPGYEAAMKGVEQRMATSGTLYSGARIGKSEQTQGQFYQNYMNMLQNLGSPGVATNLSSLGVGQAATIGGQQLSAQQIASQYEMQGREAQQAATADIVGGAANIYSGYLSTQQPTTQQQPQQQTYGSGSATAGTGAVQSGGYL